MAVSLLLDENVRGFLAEAVRQWALVEGFELDVLSVGDPGAPPLGSSDEELFDWTALEQRVLVSRDVATIPPLFRDRLSARNVPVPGVLIIRPAAVVQEVVEYLAMVAALEDPDDYIGRISWIP